MLRNSEKERIKYRAQQWGQSWKWKDVNLGGQKKRRLEKGEDEERKNDSKESNGRKIAGPGLEM